MDDVLDEISGLANLDDFIEALTSIEVAGTIQQRNVIHVMLADGTPVTGFRLEEKILTDGSAVRNLILVTEP